MCGIAGYWRFGTGSDGGMSIDDCARRMAERLAHRGPDDQGVWSSSEDGLALGHRRLAIVDLSEHGHQPMASPCGRYMGVFNGEIYNFVSLKEQLQSQGLAFHGHSDTEVLLAAVSHWGLEEAVARFNGMFAFALWDRQQRRLHLVRDRLGQKPLYYGWIEDAFTFASELKTFRVLPGFTGRVCQEAVGYYLQMGYIPAPHCIYQGLHKLRPGSILSLDVRQASRRTAAAACVSYWSAPDKAQQAVRDPFRGSDEQALDELDTLLRQAVERRMLADVPLGAFLSGGIDSSLVVAVMQSLSPRPVHTYSMGFGESGSGETSYAKEIARYLDTEHTELHVTGGEAVATAPRVPSIVDEPLADFAQVPNYLIARHAREHITVALTGDGGDEFFCGYSRFWSTPRRWRRLRRFPLAVRRLLRDIKLRRTDPNDIASNRWKAALRTGSESIDELYAYQMGHWLRTDPLLAGPLQPHRDFIDGGKWPLMSEPTQRLMLTDVVFYLADVILPKVDRTSMASGLEVRSPLLDYRIAEWSWRLPLEMKLRGGRGKWILQELLARYLPRALFERPKQGFGAPIGKWLAGPLREWAEDMLSRDRLVRQGLLNPDTVRRVWSAQDLDKRRWQQRMWSVLMLQAWLESQA